MRLTVILFSLSLGVALAGCQSDTQRPPNTRKVDEINNYGEREVYFVHQKTEEREGPYYRYSTEGELVEEASYRAGQYHGQRILYFAPGDTQIVETYREGQFVGPYRSYFPNGNIELSGQYVDNKMKGIWQKFYESGELLEEVTFADNKENGPFTEYYKSGAVQVKGTYRDGDFEHGELLFYAPDGRLTKKMNCDRGVCRTVWSESKGDPMK